MDQKVLTKLQEALKGKKLIRLAHTLDEGLDQTVLDVPQEIWYKYPTMGEDFLKIHLQEDGINCVRPFPGSHRDRQYYYDHLVWKMIADKYIDQMEEDPIFFCYKNSTHLDEVCEEYGFRNFMPDYKLYKELQYKSNLEKYGVEEGAGLIPFFEAELHEVTYDQIAEKFGTTFVVQFSFSETGWNTMGSRDTHIIESKQEFEDLQKDHSGTMPAKISKFITGYAVCMNVVNTEKGAVTSDLYLQVIGEPNLSNDKVTLSGANFTQSASFIPEIVQKKAELIAKNMGKELYKKNYKGHFGVDFMVDEQTNDVYVLEINPRFTGSTFMHTFLADSQDKVPLNALHFCEYLECLPESFNVEEYENSMRGIWKGGSMYVRNNEEKVVQILDAPRPGIYKIVGDDIEYVGEAYTMKDLPEKDHFLVKQVHSLKRNINPVDPLCHVYTLEKMFEGNDKLLDRYVMVNKKLYEKFQFSEANTYDSSVPYKVI